MMKIALPDRSEPPTPTRQYNARGNSRPLRDDCRAVGLRVRSTCPLNPFEQAPAKRVASCPRSASIAAGSWDARPPPAGPCRRRSCRRGGARFAPTRIGVIGLGHPRDGPASGPCSKSKGRRSSPSATPSPSTSLRASGDRREGQRDPARRRSSGSAQVFERPDDRRRGRSPCRATSTPRPTRDALRAGKHLYGEKPLAPSPWPSATSVARRGRARSPDLIVHVGYQRRSEPPATQRRRLPDPPKGDLGPLVSGSVHLDQLAMVR